MIFMCTHHLNYSEFQLRWNMACSVKALRSPLCRSVGHGNCSSYVRLFFTIRLNSFRGLQTYTKGYAVLSRNTPCSDAIEIRCMQMGNCPWCLALLYNFCGCEYRYNDFVKSDWSRAG